MANKYKWRYCSVGGVARVIIDSGSDIAHLGELDQKLWTALSCPVQGLEFDNTTLQLLDADHDGRIRAAEVAAAAGWLTSVLKNNNLILKGEDKLRLEDINKDCEAGRKLFNSARQILSDLGAQKDEISLTDVSDTEAIFSKTQFNGDGIITPASADDKSLSEVIECCIKTSGSVIDRSGEPGVNAELIESFYSSLADYSAWMAEAVAGGDDILPYGDDTQAALEACDALKDKISDFFTRCRLINFDKDVAAAVEVPVSSISELALCPIARPDASAMLAFNRINPAWQPAFDKFKALVLDMDFKDADSISEAQWLSVLSKFGHYKEWMSARKGESVSSLGIEKVNEILQAGQKDMLLDLVSRDKALEEESNSILDVRKLLYLNRDFARFLGNYVIFSDFYRRDPAERAIFEVGQLYIDRRCCDLCVRVSDMSKHADMAKQSGMFLIYCNCVSKVKNQTMDIVAVMTDGDTSALQPGKNGIFYDLDGQDWDATVTKVVDNPVSIKQAFWAPYRKFWNFCVGLLNKSASDKEGKVMAKMESNASASLSESQAPVPAAAGAPPAVKTFDIAKFAGIFAAIGLALGYLGQFLTQLAAGIAKTPLWGSSLPSRSSS